MIEVIKYNDITYPKFQAEGNAAQFAIPYAKQVCKGKGVDIGCGKVEWSFPGSKPIDFTLGFEYHAFNLPDMDYDYIFSSHLLEHLEKWVEAISYWTDCLKKGGVLFLYLPDYSQEYWRPWNNPKHKSVIQPSVIYDYMKHLKYTNIFLSERDLNNSFMIFGEKTTTTQF